MSSFIKWIKTLWNINNILLQGDKAIDQNFVKIGSLQCQIVQLRTKLRELSDKLEHKTTIPVEIIDDQPRNIKVDKYYDPQLNVEYVDIEINGEKASPNDDTVKE